MIPLALVTAGIVVAFAARGIARRVRRADAARVSAEWRLRDAERRAGELFAAAPVASYRARLDGTVLAVNRALVSLLAFPSAESLVGRNVADLYVDPEEHLRHVAVTPGDPAFETRVRSATGRVVWVEERGRMLGDASGRELCYEGIWIDISERKHLEARLRQSAPRETGPPLHGWQSA